jgi:hypothetical protein
MGNPHLMHIYTSSSCFVPNLIHIRQDKYLGLRLQEKSSSSPIIILLCAKNTLDHAIGEFVTHDLLQFLLTGESPVQQG